MEAPNLRYLQTSLSRIDALIRAAVERAQTNGATPTDALRGLVVSDDEVGKILDQTPLSGLWDDQGDLTLDLPREVDGVEDLPFLHLIDSFHLSILDAYLLLFCLAPELDRRYERVYAYLQDDMSQRRVTVNLLMNLLGGTVEQRFAVWERLKPGSPLRDHRLVNVVPNNDKPNAAGLSHLLQVEDRVVEYLLGSDMPDERLRRAVLPPSADDTVGLPEEAFTLLAAQMDTSPMVFMKGRREMGQASTAAALVEPYDLSLLHIDGARLRVLDVPFAEMWRIMLREGYLRGAALMIERWTSLLGEDKQPDYDFWTALVRYPYPIFICAEEEWEPIDPMRRRPLLRTELSVPQYPDRLAAWEHFTQTVGVPADADIIEELAQKFRLSREQIARAVRSAWDFGASRGGDFEPDDLYAGVQAHISLSLGQLADRIIPRFTWDDLILPPDQLQQLHEITDRARFAHRVQNDWGFAHRIKNVAGVSALFSGESGTGKTLAVQVIANDLGLALYRVDLSAIVSKYIGETEKNLSVIFTEARSSNAILFFDEADAIFGKRSEVKDARDRYANIEIAYLLQQIEDYDGVAIMATNLRQNLDEAFTRRLDFMIDFPYPDEDYRERLWTAHFPTEAPLSGDVDIPMLAGRYRMSGGNIRNVALASAFLAAADGGTITMDHVRSAVRREHQKMGRLLEEL